MTRQCPSRHRPNIQMVIGNLGTVISDRPTFLMFPRVRTSVDFPVSTYVSMSPVPSRMKKSGTPPPLPYPTSPGLSVFRSSTTLPVANTGSEVQGVRTDVRVV